MNHLKHLCYVSGRTSNLLCLKPLEVITKRNAVVLRRKYPMRLHKMGEPPKVFRPKDYVYEVVKDEHFEKKENIDVLLTSYVEGLGKPGDVVSVRPFAGYDNLLLPGLAVYATPENLKKYAGLASDTAITTYSSKYSYKTLKLLAYRIIGVSMNDTQPWTLEPWHMRVAFRMNRFVVPDSAIEMPPRPISGPHKEQHRKEFYVTVSISEKERVKVRCRIHLIGINSDPVPPDDWTEPCDPLFEEDRETLESMPSVQSLPYISKVKLYYSH